jgi:uncharacterized membrane protein
MTGNFVNFAPLIEVWVIVTVGAIGLIIVSFGLVKRMSGSLLRLLFLSVLIVALFNPTLVHEQREPKNDVAVVLVDRTSSQNVGNRQEQTETALSSVREKIKAFPNLDVREVEVFDGLGGDGNDGSNLTTALNRAISDIPNGRFAGTIMITDGQVHDTAASKFSDAAGGPIHVLLSGQPDERDRRLVIENAPSYGIVGQDVSIAYHVEDKTTQGQSQRLDDLANVILRDGVNVIAQAQVPVGKTDVFTFPLDHAGSSILEIEVAPVDGELSTLNNRTLVTLNGVRDRLKVLLVSGKPHAGERTWRNLLKADPSVDLVHFTILRPPEKDDFTPLNELALISFPTRELFEIKLNEFDLVVFDRYILRDILPPSYLQNISDYVSNGGAILLSVGSEFSGSRSLSDTALGKIIPARPTGNVMERAFRPDVSDIGRRHPVTEGLSSLARINRDNPNKPGWGRWFRQIDATVTSGATLLTGADERPLLVLDRQQDGRVALMLSDQTWLWARGYDGGGPQAELLRRLAHWLMKEPDLEEENLRASVSGGEVHIHRQSLSEDLVTVEITAPSGKIDKVKISAGANGGGRISVPATEVGLYKISDGTFSVRATSGSLNPLEFADLRSTREHVEPLVNGSQGGLFRLSKAIPEMRRIKADRALSGRDWIGLKENNAYVVTGVIQFPLLPGLVLVGLLLGLLMTTWWREGRS